MENESADAEGVGQCLENLDVEEENDEEEEFDLGLEEVDRVFNRASTHDVAHMVRELSLSSLNSKRRVVGSNV